MLTLIVSQGNFAFGRLGEGLVRDTTDLILRSRLRPDAQANEDTTEQCATLARHVKLISTAIAYDLGSLTQRRQHSNQLPSNNDRPISRITRHLQC